ncbi:site-specific DNA-cytosine methylase [Bradyrhizobium sp. i1.4.4]
MSKVSHFPSGTQKTQASRRILGPGTRLESYAEAIERALADRYHVFTSIIRCSEHGIPQSRPRFILIGYSKEVFDRANIPQPFDLLDTCKEELLAQKGLKCRTTAKQAISDLEISRNGLVDGDGSPRFKSIGYKGPLSNYQKVMRDGHSGVLSDTRLARHRPDIARRFARIIAAMKKRDRLGIQLNAEQRKGIRRWKIDPARAEPGYPRADDNQLAG